MNPPLKMSVHMEEWALTAPFRIAGLTYESYRLTVVELTDGHYVGRGESAPVRYLGETEDSVCRQVEDLAAVIERGLDREALLDECAPGSARNAVDCALWDWEVKRARQTIWDKLSVDPRPVTTSFTIGLEDTPEEMALRAAQASEFRTLKIKLNADRPIERIAAVKEARPDATLTADANQAWSFEQLQSVAPKLRDLGVRLIEQPLARGEDAILAEYPSPVPLCADESCQHRGELADAVKRYQIINVKLDKAGGLTEALYLAQAVKQAGRQLLVSCMGGTSLAMAPGLVLAQLADYPEIDGHLLLRQDRLHALICRQGQLQVPDSRLWG